MTEQNPSQTSLLSESISSQTPMIIKSINSNGEEKYLVQPTENLG